MRRCIAGKAGRLKGDMVHDAYPSLGAYIAHMDRYSTLGAEHAVREGKGGGFPLAFVANVVVNPVATLFITIFFGWDFWMDERGCCCICTTRFM